MGNGVDDIERQMIGPRRKRILSERGDRERLLRTRPAKGPKKHSVNRERSREEAGRVRRGRHVASVKLRLLQSYRDAVAAFWRGDIDDHPMKPEGL